MNNCLYCNKETNNPKFCSRSCACSFNNKIHSKRAKTHHCKNCSNIISSRHTYCSDICKITYTNLHKLPKKSNSEKVKQARRNVKELSVEYKGDKCIICGYHNCINALEFHHIDPKQKEIQIGSGNYRGIDKVKLELDKCILVCSNCHREIHAGLHPEYLIK
jgi:hypothetical protein